MQKNKKIEVTEFIKMEKLIKFPLKFLRYPYHYKFLIRLFRVLHRFNLDHIIAAVMLIYTKRLTSKLKTKINILPSKNYRVLAFDRPQFRNDLIEINKRTDIEVMYFPMLMYSTFFRSFSPGYLKNQLKYHTYDSPEELKHKQALYKACKNVLPLLLKKLNIAAIISGNTDYGLEQPWMDVGRKFNIPWVSVVKEGMSTDYGFSWTVDHYSDERLRFKGNKITVMCERRKNAMVQAGVAKEEDIIITGLPRTDLVFETVNGMSLKKSNKENWVLLFAFNNEPLPILWNDTLSVFTELAENLTNKKLKFVIKTKDISDQEEMQSDLKRLKLSKSLIVSNKISFQEIVEKSILIIGYRSTAIVELMATDIPIIIPHLAEAIQMEASGNYMFDTKVSTHAYQVVRDKSGLESKIRNCVFNVEHTKNQKGKMRRDRESLIEKYVFRIDGHCSHRVANVIKGCICGMNQ